MKIVFLLLVITLSTIGMKEDGEVTPLMLAVNQLNFDAAKMILKNKPVITADQEKILLHDCGCYLILMNNASAYNKLSKEYKKWQKIYRLIIKRRVELYDAQNGRSNKDDTIDLQ